METIIRTPALVGARRLDDVPAPLQEVSVPVRPERPLIDVDAIRKEIEAKVRADLSAEAQRQFERAKAQGQEQGYQAGREEAERRALESAARAKEEQLREFRRTLGEMRQALDTHIVAMESRLVDLVDACLCRLLGAALVEPETILAGVRHVLHIANAADRIRIRLHPDDLACLQARYDLEELASGDQSVEFVADVGMAGGGCVAETAVGQFDASMDSQLRNLHAILHETRVARRKE
jgi:flagellar assembly protein FliH